MLPAANLVSMIQSRDTRNIERRTRYFSHKDENIYTNNVWFPHHMKMGGNSQHRMGGKGSFRHSFIRSAQKETFLKQNKWVGKRGKFWGSY